MSHPVCSKSNQAIGNLVGRDTMRVFVDGPGMFRKALVEKTSLLSASFSVMSHNSGTEFATGSTTGAGWQENEGLEPAALARKKSNMGLELYRHQMKTCAQ